MKMTIVLLVLLLSCLQANAAETIQEISRKIAINEQISENMVKDSIELGLWDSNKTAVAFTIKKADESLCFILIRHSKNSFMAVDIRNVESGNFGKFGYPRSYYDWYETVPKKWLERDDSHYQVVFQTRAWKDGQRYTVEEPFVVKKDGTPLWR